MTAKRYIKRKLTEKNPGYRTADYFKGKTFQKISNPPVKFNPASFKTQHRG